MTKNVFAYRWFIELTSLSVGEASPGSSRGMGLSYCPPSELFLLRSEARPLAPPPTAGCLLCAATGGFLDLIG